MDDNSNTTLIIEHYLKFIVNIKVYYKIHFWIMSVEENGQIIAYC